MTVPPITIPPALLQRCFAHGAETYPEEGCGVLSGPAGDAETLEGWHPIPNILNRMHAEDPTALGALDDPDLPKGAQTPAEQSAPQFGA